MSFRQQNVVPIWEFQFFWENMSSILLINDNTCRMHHCCRFLMTKLSASGLSCFGLPLFFSGHFQSFEKTVPNASFLLYLHFLKIKRSWRCVIADVLLKIHLCDSFPGCLCLVIKVIVFVIWGKICLQNHVLPYLPSPTIKTS